MSPSDETKLKTTHRETLNPLTKSQSTFKIQNFPKVADFDIVIVYMILNCAELLL